MTFDFEWAELPDDIAQAKQQVWQQWETIDHQLHDPAHPLPPKRLMSSSASSGPPGSSTGTPTAPATTSPTAR